MSEPSIVSGSFKTLMSFMFLLLLIFLFNYLQNMMLHNLHGNDLRKSKKVQSHFRLGPGLWRTKPDLFSPWLVDLNPGHPWQSVYQLPCVLYFSFFFEYLVHRSKYTRIGPPLRSTTSTHVRNNKKPPTTRPHLHLMSVSDSLFLSQLCSFQA